MTKLKTMIAFFQLAIWLVLMSTSHIAADENKMNVLFISVDDLNDWIGCLGGHPQIKTPNIDRLASSGVLFTNAHCPAPACNPSRTAIMTGIPTYKSGLYDNRQKMRTKLPNAELIPKYFSNNGYWSAGSGKILHYFTDAASWDEYFPPKETEDPFPRTLYPEKRPVSLPRGGSWQYIETDWGPLGATDEEFGGDWLVSKWVGKQLERKHEKPFFLACGIYRPHEPWFVPKKYFEQFPLSDIQLPPGYKADDLDDLPPAGQKAGPNRYFAHIQQHGQWKHAVQGYLASITFADAMIGRVMDSLEKGPNKENTIVVLWSDHGWHLGEKQHWQKYTAWRACTRVPLIVKVPKGAAGLPAGTVAGSQCSQPVSLISLFSTLTDLAGLPEKVENREWIEHSPSLVPLLKDVEADWPHKAITQLSRPDTYSVSGKRFRYIHYSNGNEELYDIATDPFEWKNLANDSDYSKQLARLKQHGPTDPAEFVAAKAQALGELAFMPASGKEVPASKPNGDKLSIHFSNESGQPVNIHWMDRQGKPKPYGTLETGWFKPLTSRPGAVWMITNKDGVLLGHFVVGKRSARAVVPKK